MAGLLFVDRLCWSDGKVPSLLRQLTAPAQDRRWLIAIFEASVKAHRQAHAYNDTPSTFQGPPLFMEQGDAAPPSYSYTFLHIRRTNKALILMFR